MPTLLKTKLQIPPLRKKYVHRTRLIDRFEDGYDCKITILSAPAGFGKTTLLSEWVNSCGPYTAWISLGIEDNDPVQFIDYLINAIRGISPDFGEDISDAIKISRDQIGDLMLTNIVNQLAAVPLPFVLILDDYHLITDNSIHQIVTFIIQNQPPQMHTIISGRADPPWPMARLRAQNEINELRSSDLRFTLEETSHFLTDVMGVELDESAVAELDRRTEGWIAGLQMAAISMRGKGNPGDFVKAFAGSHRYVLDYLLEEVLNQQPPEIQEFLLKTSILDNLNGSLCEVVTGDDQSQLILEKLEFDNLFVTPLDNERLWFRYHHLFADLLQKRLNEVYPDSIPDLNLRASSWFEENDLVGDAVKHAFIANDEERVVYLVETNALEMSYHGEIEELFLWLDYLPVELVKSRPWLSLARGWAAIHAGDIQNAEHIIKDVENLLMNKTIELSHDDESHISGHISAMLAYIAYTREEILSSIDHANAALESLPESDFMARGWASIILGAMLRAQGDLETSESVLTDAVEMSVAAGDIQFAVEALWELAVLHHRQCRLYDVEKDCRKAINLAEEHVKLGGDQLLVTGYTYARLGFIHLDWNDTETAFRYALDGKNLCQTWGMADARFQSLITLAYVLGATRDRVGLENVLQTLKALGQRISLYYEAMSQIHEAQIFCYIGDTDRAKKWLESSGIHPNDAISYHRIAGYITLALISVVTCEEESNHVPAEIMDLLNRLLKICANTGSVRFEIIVLTIFTIASHLNGDPDQARIHLENALLLAEPHSYKRVFIDLGHLLIPILNDLIDRQIMVNFSNILVAEIINRPEYEMTLQENQTIEYSLPDKYSGTESFIPPLTRRELQILRMLDSPASVPEISNVLYISVSTVRSHIKSIYNKLDVHSRFEAVERAKNLQIL